MEEEYLIELKKDYVGYSDDTSKSLLHHLNPTGCKITTLEKGSPWEFFEHRGT